MALLAVRDLAHRPVRFARETDVGERRERAFPRLRVAVGAAPRDSLSRRGARKGRDPDVVEEREGGKDVGALERAREAQVRDAMRGRPGDLASVERDRPGSRRERAGEQVEERRFPGAVRPDDRMQRARLDREAHA